MNGLYSIAQDNNEGDVKLNIISEIPYSACFSWSGYLAGEKYRHSLNTLLDLIEQRNIKYLLHDYSHIKVIHPSDQLWFKEVYVPRLNQSTLTLSLMVKPAEPRALDCIMHMAAKNDCLLMHDVMLYSSYDQAYSALKNMAVRGV